MLASARAKEAPSDQLSLEERIRRRAYELYIERGSQCGSDLDDWLQAEEQILRAGADARVDESSEESFPASDSPTIANATTFPCGSGWNCSSPSATPSNTLTRRASSTAT